MAGANPTGRQQIDTLCTQGFECPQNLLTDDELSRLSVEKPARWCAQLKEQLDWKHANKQKLLQIVALVVLCNTHFTRDES